MAKRYDDAFGFKAEVVKFSWDLFREGTVFIFRRWDGEVNEWVNDDRDSATVFHAANGVVVARASDGVVCFDRDAHDEADGQWFVGLDASAVQPARDTPARRKDQPAAGAKRGALALAARTTGAAALQGLAIGQGRAAVKLLDEHLVPLGALLGISAETMKKPEIRRAILLAAPTILQFIAHVLPGVRDIAYIQRAIAVAQTASFADAVGDGEAKLVMKVMPMLTGLVSIGKQVAALTGDDDPQPALAEGE